MIIADLMMEHYDSGFVFCKKVRELPGLQKVPILMQTAAPRKVGFTFETGAVPGPRVDEGGRGAHQAGAPGAPAGQDRAVPFRQGAPCLNRGPLPPRTASPPRR